MYQELKFEVTFEVPSKCIFQALTEQFEVMKYTRSPAVVEPKPQGKYSILEGRITGTFLEVDNTKKHIKMTWRMKDWKSDSLVNFTFIDRDDECTLSIVQSDIPNDVNCENLRKGWMTQIFEPMSSICGYPIDN
ncbi:Hsp90 ATPase activator (macronuclear) [Tetrahymena thermophila SB210]|uniref:Hsp90 ATPase activator n=1 Tax=Tetrahymena thermophila (strain SB210) TaxID=312017 RepID=I7LUZ8_TETTS|nr:Hsp90 ATPase activator [Tetrahymena thermophila SB210]EAR96374.2 Hsp90 ATPase activator [Tetrahymena thermophila SB210]|eukprot:XP_001016619.2 Hsp90 ATPase activator [Tetrahymena thermophila SB210]